MTFLILLAMVVGVLLGYFFCRWQVAHDEDLVYISSVRGLKCCHHGGQGYQLKRTPPSGMLDPNIDGVAAVPEKGEDATMTLQDAVGKATPIMMAYKFHEHLSSTSVLRIRFKPSQVRKLFLDAEPWKYNLINGRNIILAKYGEKTGAGPREMWMAKVEIFNALIAVCSDYAKPAPEHQQV